LPTSNQKKILETIGENLQNVKVDGGVLGKSPASVRMAETELFHEFMEDLDLMIRFYPVFERRFRLAEKRAGRGGDGAYARLRRLARLIHREAG
jgi:hypothetical protein